jgi:excinuclease UvrABC ATPase subunit
VLVEHDAETIRAADYVSIRPGGEKRNGGHIMAEARGAGAGPAKSPPRALAESAG